MFVESDGMMSVEGILSHAHREYDGDLKFPNRAKFMICFHDAFPGLKIRKLGGRGNQQRHFLGISPVSKAGKRYQYLPIRLIVAATGSGKTFVANGDWIDIDIECAKRGVWPSVPRWWLDTDLKRQTTLRVREVQDELLSHGKKVLSHMFGDERYDNCTMLLDLDNDIHKLQLSRREADSSQPTLNDWEKIEATKLALRVSALDRNVPIVSTWEVVMKYTDLTIPSVVREVDEPPKLNEALSVVLSSIGSL